MLTMGLGIARFFGRTTLFGEQLPDAVVASAKTRAHAGAGAALLAFRSCAGCRAALTPASDALEFHALGMRLELMELHGFMKKMSVTS